MDLYIFFFARVRADPGPNDIAVVCRAWYAHCAVMRTNANWLARAARKNTESEYDRHMTNNNIYMHWNCSIVVANDNEHVYPQIGRK